MKKTGIKKYYEKQKINIYPEEIQSEKKKKKLLKKSCHEILTYSGPDFI